MAGTLVLTDTLGNVFDRLFGETTKGVDVVVRARQNFDVSNQQSGGDDTNQRNPVPASLLDVVRGVDGVRAAEGCVSGTASVVGSDGDVVKSQAPIGLSWSPDPRFHSSWHRVQG